MATDSLDFVQRGKVCIVRRQYAEAIKICRLGLLGQPSLLEGRLVLGMALTALGRWDEVLAEMRVALETDGNAPLAWLLKGEALVGKGDYGQAEATLKRARELDPSNAKADKLLAEIANARAAGFEGLPSEPTDTKVYPAKKGGGTDPEIANLVQPMPMDRGALVAVDNSDEISVEYEDESATEVDADPSKRNKVKVDAKEQPPSVLVNFGETEDTVEDSQITTETFNKPEPPADPLADRRGRRGDDSYEPPPPEDYGEIPRPRQKTYSRPTLTAKKPQPRADQELEVSEPSIVLDSSDLMAPSGEGFPRGFAPTFDSEGARRGELEAEQTRQRRQRQVDEHAGTTPFAERGAAGAPEPALQRPRPARHEVPSAMSPGPPSSGGHSASLPPSGPISPLVPGPLSVGARVSQPSFPLSSNELPTELGRDGIAPRPEREPAPGVVRVPLRPPPRRETQLTRSQPHSWIGDQSRRGIALLFTALFAVVAVGVATGLLVREWRMRARIGKRHELARQKLASGNYPGFQSAELLYRQILAERDDAVARAMRARVLAQMAFEFGDTREAAERAVAPLPECGDKKASGSGCEDAGEARVYLALAKGDGDGALRLAQAERRRFADAASAYLVGRAELLLEHNEGAVEALRAAADGDAHNPVYLHALGLAEAAAHNDERAYDAYRRALLDNANHIATIVDRALLYVDRGTDRAAAEGALQGVVGKLGGDSSPGQLARAYLGLARIALQRGDTGSARRFLAQASAKRRDGDTLLSEELAQSDADAYMLDEAEREAKRAMAGSSRLRPRLVLAEVALRRAQPKKALAAVDAAGSARPEALVVRAVASLMLGRLAAARTDAEAALRIDSSLVRARVVLARVDLAEGHAERAIRTLDAYEQSGLKSHEVASALGSAYVVQKNPDRARWWFKEALKRDPLDGEARLSLAKLEHDLGQFDAARAELNQLFATNAGYAPARRELALLSLDAGDPVAARDELDALTASDENADFDTLLYAAKAHLMLGDGKGAEERLLKAHKLGQASDHREEVDDLLARAYLIDHKAADAAALLKKSVPTATRGETAALLMEAYLDLEEPDRAAEVVRLVPPRARTGVELVVARARLQVERGRDSVAEGFAEEAIARLRGPRASRALKAEAYTILGRAEYESGNFRAALKSLKTATELDAHMARAWYYLGLVDEDLKKLPEAKEAMETATKSDALAADAFYFLGRYRTMLGEANAAEAFKRYLELAPKGVYAEEVARALGRR